MRIGIGGIMHESNTFAPLPADRRRFEEGSLTRGDALLPVWREAHHEMGGDGVGCFLRAADPLPQMIEVERVGHDDFRTFAFGISSCSPIAGTRP